MKKGIQLLSILLCLIICLFSFAGCYKDELRFLYKKMDEFEIECKDYSLIQSEEELGTGQHVKIIYDGTVLLNGNELKIEYQNNLDGFKLTYQNNELNINSRFMSTYSQTYYDIHKIWGGWRNKNNQEYEPDFTVNDVVGVIVYDNEIFIFVWREDTRLANVRYSWGISRILNQNSVNSEFANRRPKIFRSPVYIFSVAILSFKEILNRLFPIQSLRRYQTQKRIGAYFQRLL